VDLIVACEILVTRNARSDDFSTNRHEYCGLDIESDTGPGRSSFTIPETMRGLCRTVISDTFR